MNTCIFMGRLTDEPSQMTTLGGKKKVNFRLAVPKKFKRDDGPTADFFNCEAWEVNAENIFKYFHKGDGIMVKGRMENDNYTNRDGQKVYGMIFKVEEWDFGPKKVSNDGVYQSNQGSYGGYNSGNNFGPTPNDMADGFMNIPEGIDEELPFS